MIFTIGLDLKTGDEKVELSSETNSLLKEYRTLIFSVKEIIPSEEVEPSSLGYISFSNNLCNCSNSVITKEKYQKYSGKIFYVFFDSYCTELIEFGCHFIKSYSPYKEYFSYNNKKYLIDKQSFTYQSLLENSVESNEDCPNGKYKCEGYFDNFKNHYCADSKDKCPITNITINEKVYGGNQYFLTGFGLNVKKTGQYEISHSIEKSNLISREISKYKLFNENNLLNDLSKTLFYRDVPYPINDFSLNQSMVELVYQTSNYNTLGMKRNCLNSIPEIQKVANDFNDMIYSSFNGVSFGLSVGAVGIAFYALVIGCPFQGSCPKVTCVFFMLLTILNYGQFITNTIFLAEITNDKYDYKDECQLFKIEPVNILNRNRTLVKICEWFLVVVIILGTIVSYCLIKMSCKKNSDKSSDSIEAKKKNDDKKEDKNIEMPSCQSIPYTSNSDLAYTSNSNYSPYQVSLNSPVGGLVPGVPVVPNVVYLPPQFQPQPQAIYPPPPYLQQGPQPILGQAPILPYNDDKP